MRAKKMPIAKCILFLSLFFFESDSNKSTRSNLIDEFDSLQLLSFKEQFACNPLTPYLLSYRKQINKSAQRIERIPKGIRIIYENRTYYYQQDQVWSLEHERRPPSIVRRTANSLNKLRKKSRHAAGLIQTLEESDFDIIIEITESTVSYILVPVNDQYGFLNNNAYAFQILEKQRTLVSYTNFSSIGSGSKIRWNPNKQSLIALAHELGHAFDANFGLLNNELVRVQNGYITHREVRALHHENRIRKDLKLPYRTHMNNIRVFQKPRT